MSRRYRFVTLDVFTATRFGGNQLAVFPEAEGISDAEMLALTREFNYSEATFVLPPANPAHTARVRIFNPAGEMPFAGHPNVGTGYALAERAEGGRLRFEEIAGLVEVAVQRGPDGALLGTSITAPQPLTLGAVLPAGPIAACAGLAAADVVLAAHPPQVAGMGNGFVIARVTPEALTRAAPDTAAFNAVLTGMAPLGQLRLALFLYARAGGHIRARMFAPLAGIAEDPATGSAAVSLAGLLHGLGGESEFTIHQGVEMGRPSLLQARAWRDATGIRASVGGGCVPVMQGEVTLD